MCAHRTNFLSFYRILCTLFSLTVPATMKRQVVAVTLPEIYLFATPSGKTLRWPEAKLPPLPATMIPFYFHIPTPRLVVPIPLIVTAIY